MPPRKQYRCRFCGVVLPAWLPVAQEPDEALLLEYLGRQHPDQVPAYLDRMHATEDIAPLAAQPSRQSRSTRPGEGATRGTHEE